MGSSEDVIWQGHGSDNNALVMTDCMWSSRRRGGSVLQMICVMAYCGCDVLLRVSEGSSWPPWL